MKKIVFFLVLLIPVICGCESENNNPVSIKKEINFSFVVTASAPPYESMEVLFCTDDLSVAPHVMINGVEIEYWERSGDCFIGQHLFDYMSDEVVLAIRQNDNVYVKSIPIPVPITNITCNGVDMNTNSVVPFSSTYTFSWPESPVDYYRSSFQWGDRAITHVPTASFSTTGDPNRIYFWLMATVGVLPEPGAIPNFRCGYGDGWVEVRTFTNRSISIDNDTGEKSVTGAVDTKRRRPDLISPEELTNRMRLAIDGM